MSGAAADRAGPEPVDRGWADVMLVIRLLAVDPFALGGIVVRGRPGPVRDRVCALLRAQLPPGPPVARIPLHVTEDRLLGGISLPDTLHHGRVVREPGLLARSHGGIVEVAMAERVESHVVSHLCAAVDRGELVLERDSVSARVPCRLGLVVLDEGIDDEHAPPALYDRLAFWLALDRLDPRAAPPPGDALVGERPGEQRATPSSVRARLGDVRIESDAIEALCRAALSLGIPDLRAVLLAATAARVHAAIAGRRRVEAPDLDVAARLVLGPRATPAVDPDLPEPPPEDERASAPEPPPAEPPSPEPTPPDEGDSIEPAASSPPDPPEDQTAEEQTAEASLNEIVLDAAKSGIPDGLLDSLRAGAIPRNAPRRSGQAGATKASRVGGRPVGTRAGIPSHGARLHVLETLRAAAPWQRLRRDASRTSHTGRLQIRREDFRVRQFRQRTETCVIFAVDASGSSAQQRLAEAKGAVERVLADCYVRRDHVALIAFRGTQATVVLPPTRSLARVRRRLAALAGGGSTPLAAGIDAALALAHDARDKGRAPLVVLMTDGRGNVARDGRSGASQAQEDALESSRRLRHSGVPALLLDTAPRPRPRVRRLAEQMNARYLPLPYLDPAGISREVQSLARESACR
ncbi:MAG: magnesium chelatase subunit D [Myxococcota bacterium]